MTDKSKELELFKRWYGWDPSKIEGFVDLEISRMDSFADVEIYIDYFLSKEELEEVIKIKEFNHITIGKVENEVVFVLNFNIPHKYYEDWEKLSRVFPPADIEELLSDTKETDK
jgi:hypothetical protein